MRAQIHVGAMAAGLLALTACSGGSEPAATSTSTTSAVSATSAAQSADESAPQDVSLGSLRPSTEDDGASAKDACTALFGGPEAIRTRVGPDVELYLDAKADPAATTSLLTCTYLPAVDPAPSPGGFEAAVLTPGSAGGEQCPKDVCSSPGADGHVVAAQGLPPLQLDPTEVGLWLAQVLEHVSA